MWKFLLFLQNTLVVQAKWNISQCYSSIIGYAVVKIANK